MRRDILFLDYVPDWDLDHYLGHVLDNDLDLTCGFPTHDILHANIYFKDCIIQPIRRLYERQIVMNHH